MKKKPATRIALIIIQEVNECNPDQLTVETAERIPSNIKCNALMNYPRGQMTMLNVSDIKKSSIPVKNLENS